MSQPNVEKEVRVTAQERAHPSLRVLARACIALARHELATGRTAPATTEPSGSEADHD